MITESQEKGLKQRKEHFSFGVEEMSWMCFSELQRNQRNLEML